MAKRGAGPGFVGGGRNSCPQTGAWAGSWSATLKQSTGTSARAVTNRTRSLRPDIGVAGSLATNCLDW